jgi:hypothetical protein
MTCRRAEVLQRVEKDEKEFKVKVLGVEMQKEKL